MRHLTPFYLLIVLALGLAASPAGAQADETDVVDVFKLAGLLDPINADALVERIDSAESDGSLALVVQVNSGGSVLSDDEFADLRDAVRDATVPIAFWVGPAGSSAVGDTALLMVDVDLIGISPGSRFGRVADDRPLPADSPFEALAGRTGGVDDVRAVGLPVTDAAILGDFLLAMEDQGVVGEITEVTTGDDGVPRRATAVQVRFSSCS